MASEHIWPNACGSINARVRRDVDAIAPKLNPPLLDIKTIVRTTFVVTSETAWETVQIRSCDPRRFRRVSGRPERFPTSSETDSGAVSIAVIVREKESE